MNHDPFSFTMLWRERNFLYLVQMPKQGKALQRDYHTIEIGANNSCEEYNLIDDEMKIEDILNPYEDFEACFIHESQQIICFGPKGFTSYDIDLNKSKVYNA